MFSWLTRKLFSPRKGNTERGDTVGNASAAATPKRPVKPEWQRVLMASMEQNSVAPSDDVILHSFDLYRDDLYAPFLDRRRQMAGLHAAISADVAALNALVPDLIERAMSRHPFEFSRTLERQETDR